MVYMRSYFENYFRNLLNRPLFNQDETTMMDEQAGETQNLFYDIFERRFGIPLELSLGLV